MALEIKKEVLSSHELFSQSKCEEGISLEISLPDYCADVKRILKCIVTPGISNVSVSGEAVSLSGSVVTRLVYAGEGEKIDCYEHVSPLSCSVKISNLPENAVFKTVTKTDYVNCRAVSQRRISVSGNISALVYAYTETKTEVPTEIEGLSVQCKREKADRTNLVCLTEKTFDLSETVALDGDKADIGKIIRCDSFVRLDSKKAVADKLLIKGDLCCEILYADSEKGALHKIRHTMPISQIINLTGVTDKNDTSLSFTVGQFMVSGKNDSSGRCRLLEFAARVSALVRCTEDKEVYIIDDCYSTEYEVAGDYKLTDISKLIMNETKELMCEETVAFSEGEISEMYDMWCSDVSCNISGKKDSADGEYSFLLSGIYRDKTGVLRYGEKNVSGKINLPLKKSGENVKCDCSVWIPSLEYSPMGDGKVKIKAAVCIGCNIYSGEHKRILTSLKVDEEKKKEEIYPALCLYFAQKNEKIWDIARKYNTRVELIKEENSIKGMTVEDDRMIMIPCV